MARRGRRKANAAKFVQFFRSLRVLGFPRQQLLWQLLRLLDERGDDRSGGHVWRPNSYIRSQHDQN
jgi:hypothetical protein